MHMMWGTCPGRAIEELMSSGNVPRTYSVTIDIAAAMTAWRLGGMVKERRRFCKLLSHLSVEGVVDLQWYKPVYRKSKVGVAMFAIIFIIGVVF